MAFVYVVGLALCWGRAVLINSLLMPLCFQRAAANRGLAVGCERSSRGRVGRNHCCV